MGQPVEGRGDAAQCGLREKGIRRKGKTEKGRCGDTGTRGYGDTETRRRGETETRRDGETEKSAGSQQLAAGRGEISDF